MTISDSDYFSVFDSVSVSVSVFVSVFISVTVPACVSVAVSLAFHGVQVIYVSFSLNANIAVGESVFLTLPGFRQVRVAQD
jgi:hypothetical protein